MAFVRHLGYEHLNFVNTPALCWNCRGVRGFSPPPSVYVYSLSLPRDAL